MTFPDAMKAARIRAKAIADEKQRDEMLAALQHIDDQHQNDLVQAADYRRAIEQTRKA